MKQFFLLAIEIPVSYNNNNTKPKYQERLSKLAKSEAAKQDIFWKKGDKVNLYARVYYFHKGPRQIDADNLSKPVLDALSKIVYEDDNLVIDRQAVKINLREKDGYSLSDDLSTAWYDKLTRSMDRYSDFLFIEVGELQKISVAFGGK